MTLAAWPVDASAGAPAFDGGKLRRMFSSMWTPSGSARPLGSLSGRRVGGGLEVTVASWPTITIQPGAAVLDTQTPAATGSYMFESDAVDTSLTGTAANASNPRIDIVCVRVDDTSVDGSGLRVPAFVYVAGTAAASPSAPATPPRCLRLGTISVPQSGGGSPSVTMDSAYIVASGGVLPSASSAAYPASPYKGQPVYDLTTLRPMFYDGTRWAASGPMGYIGGVQLTANVGPTTAGTELLLASFTANVLDTSRRIKLTANLRPGATVAGDLFAYRFRLTSLAGAQIVSTPEWSVPAALLGSIAFSCIVPASVLAAGSNTIVFTVQRQSGTGTHTLNASATAIADFFAEDVGV